MGICAPFAVLLITDGTETVDLLSPHGGFYCTNWTPRITEPKGGGVWADSPIADRRQMAIRHMANVVENFTCNVSRFTQDTLIRDAQRLRRLLEKAVAYWTTSWATEPVWIEAQGAYETNRRYALIMDYRTPEDDDPQGTRFWSLLQSAAFADFTIAVEREPHWRALPPGQGECAPVSAVESSCVICHIEADGDTTLINCGSDVGIDDIPTMTAWWVDGWIRPDSFGEGGQGRIIGKTSWRIRVDENFGMVVVIDRVTDALTQIGLDQFPGLGEWIYFAFCYSVNSPAGHMPTYDRVHGNINGTWLTTYQLQQVGAGAYVSDAAFSLIIANNAGSTEGFHGGIGWIRVSDYPIYAVGMDYTPPDRCVIPVPVYASGYAGATGVLGQWIGAECSGNTIDNQEGTAARDGAATNHTFDCDCEREYGNVAVCGPGYLHFDGDNARVNCGSGPTIDDLFLTNDVTIDGWVRADTWGESNTGYIICKDSTSWWYIAINNVAGLQPVLNNAVQAAYTQTGPANFPLGTWVHFACTYERATMLWRAWVLGIEPAYLAQVAGGGAEPADNARNLYIGNNGNFTRGWNGDIGWIRLSTGLRWVADFDPPERCTIPDWDAATRLLVIYEGAGHYTYDLSGNLNHGTIEEAAWECDCLEE